MISARLRSQERRARSYLAPLAGRGRPAKHSEAGRVRGTFSESNSWREPLTPTLSPRRAGRGSAPPPRLPLYFPSRSVVSTQANARVQMKLKIMTTKKLRSTKGLSTLDDFLAEEGTRPLPSRKCWLGRSWKPRRRKGCRESGSLNVWARAVARLPGCSIQETATSLWSRCNAPLSCLAARSGSN